MKKYVTKTENRQNKKCRLFFDLALYFKWLGRLQGTKLKERNNSMAKKALGPIYRILFCYPNFVQPQCNNRFSRKCIPT